MIQLIGFMIAAYIITRMVESIGGSDSVVARAFQIITILVVVVCVFGLIATGNQVSSTLHGLPPRF